MKEKYSFVELNKQWQSIYFHRLKQLIERAPVITWWHHHDCRRHSSQSTFDCSKKKPSILIKLLADQQWCCSFVWNIQKKVIWDSAQSEIDCLIEWYSMGSFSYFLYICLVRDTKKPIILCSQYYGNDEHWLQRLFGTIHRIQPILDWAEQKKTPSMTQHGVNGWILLYYALSTIRNNFLVCICFALWFHCVMCTW